MTRASRVALSAACVVTALMMSASHAHADNLYVSDSSAGTIYVYDGNGNQTVFAQGGGLAGPEGLAFDSSGRLYVANFNVGNIFQYTPPSNSPITFASSPPLSSPADLVFDGSGNLYVSDTSANAIFQISPNGASLTTFTTGVSAPTGLAFNQGILYEADNGTGSIQRFSATGASLGAFATGLSSPEGLVFDANGDLFVSNTGANNILEYAASNGVLSTTPTTFATGLNAPIGLAIDSNGNLYEADSNSGEIFEFNTTTGSEVLFASGLNTPAYLAFAAAVPEQGSLMLMAEGMLALTGLIAWRRRRSC